MSDFEWQTEEDAEAIWESLPAETSPKQPKLPKWLGRWLLIGLGLLMVVGGVVYWQVNRRVQLATESLEAELLATHTLLQQVLDDEDEDLLRSMISGRDLNWVYAQINRMERDLTYQRPSFRLQHETTTGEPAITFSPDLAEAEITTNETYFVPAANMGGEAVTLQQTAVYRKGAEQRWLLAPPTPEFWGELAVLTGDRVTLRFPERDRAVAERLHEDLETAVSTTCTTLADLDCGLSLRVRVTLDTNASFLLRGSNREAMLRSGLEVILPTPTLVGLPIDEAGYEALRQGYRGQVLTAVIAHLIDYECCQQQHFFTALIDKQLSQLGFQPWPMTPADYDQLLLEPVNPERILRIWHSQRISNTDWRLAYGVIDFLLSDIAPNADIVAWQRQLAERLFEGSLASLLPNEQTSRVWIESWLRFLYRQTESAQAAQPPLPWPTAALFECNTLSHTVVNSFDFERQGWQEAYSIASPDNGYFQTSNRITPLPDGASFLVEQQENRIDTLHGHMLLGRDSGTVMLTTLSVDVLTSHPGFYFTGESAPDEDVVLLASRDNPRLNTRHYLLDLAACEAGDCSLSERESWFTWSPSGGQTLLAGRPPRLSEGADLLFREWQRPLTLGDDSAQPVADIGQGGRPFWVNDDQFALIQIDEPSRELQFSVLSATTYEPDFTLSASDLLPLVPDRVTNLRLFAAQPLLNERHQVLLETKSFSDSGEVETFLFLVNLLQSGSERLVLSTRSQISYDISPNGRWLSVQSENRPESVTLVDLVTKERERISAKRVRWGPNGRWLLREFEQHALLTALDHPYNFLLTLEQPNCRAIGWGAIP